MKWLGENLVIKYVSSRYQGHHISRSLKLQKTQKHTLPSIHSFLHEFWRQIHCNCITSFLHESFCHQLPIHCSCMTYWIRYLTLTPGILIRFPEEEDMFQVYWIINFTFGIREHACEFWWDPRQGSVIPPVRRYLQPLGLAKTAKMETNELRVFKCWLWIRWSNTYRPCEPSGKRDLIP